MQHLQDLGLDISDASMYYNYFDDKWILLPIDDGDSIIGIKQRHGENDIIPAFTFTDIWDKFPHTEERYAEIDNKFSEIHVFIYDSEEGYTLFSDNDLLTNAYNALCYCIEQGYIKTK